MKELLEKLGLRYKLQSLYLWSGDRTVEQAWNECPYGEWLVDFKKHVDGDSLDLAFKYINIFDSCTGDNELYKECVRTVKEETSSYIYHNIYPTLCDQADYNNPITIAYKSFCEFAFYGKWVNGRGLYWLHKAGFDTGALVRKEISMPNLQSRD